LPCWESVSWLSAEGNVRRLRQRIFTASQAGDLKRVRNLQKLMLRSRSSALVSVRRVTEVNAGRKTAGIDGEVALTGEAPAVRNLNLEVTCPHGGGGQHRGHGRLSTHWNSRQSGYLGSVSTLTLGAARMRPGAGSLLASLARAAGLPGAAGGAGRRAVR
jgi:hypothetical protein